MGWQTVEYLLTEVYQLREEDEHFRQAIHLYAQAVLAQYGLDIARYVA